MMINYFRKLLEQSLNEKKGLTFYVNGSPIPALVRRILDDQAVEVYNQQHDTIVIRLDRVDAIAIN